MEQLCQTKTFPQVFRIVEESESPQTQLVELKEIMKNHLTSASLKLNTADALNTFQETLGLAQEKFGTNIFSPEESFTFFRLQLLGIERLFGSDQEDWKECFGNYVIFNRALNLAPNSVRKSTLYMKCIKTTPPVSDVKRYPLASKLATLVLQNAYTDVSDENL